MSKFAYQWSHRLVEEQLNTHLDRGLSEHEALRRQQEEGLNQLDEGKKRSLWLKFIDQLADFMIIVLIGASILSFITGDMTEGFLIIGIVLVNAILGLAQEAKAEKALDSIKKMSSPQAKVRREGKDRLIDVKDLVKGDLVLLDAGDYVPADCRIIESINLKCDESALTGEAVPVEKISDALEEDNLPLGDRVNCGFMGTVVTYGRGKAVILQTGMQTELGKIASMLTATKDETTPLQKSMAQLGKILAVIALGITLFIFIISIVEAYIIDGFVSALIWKESFMTAIALAVAAIPEGLPAIITIVLALGMQNLVKKNAIVRTLPAVETLGSTAIICSDKTGTLTQNVMTIQKVYTNEGFKDIDHTYQTNETVSKVALYGTLCNDTKLQQKEDQLIKIGDPTEIALIDLSLAIHENPLQMHEHYPRLHELPFDSVRKLMTTVHLIDGKHVAVIKGAPDVIFSRLEAIDHDSMSHLDHYIKANQSMAEKALRVLAIAYKIIENPNDLKKLSFDDLEQDLTLLGLVGMMDPARPEVKDSIALCDQAGIITVMITGDHIHTEVAKGAADMILTDDNFSTIVNAVSEGRAIFANIKKAIHYLLSCNIGEILTIFLGTSLGLLIFGGRVTTLTAVQILWINLVTDSIMAIALGLEPKEKDIMKDMPRDTKKSIFADGFGSSIIKRGLLLGLLSFGAYTIGWFLGKSSGTEVILSQTMTFMVLAMSQLVHAFNVRSETQSIFKMKPNKAMLIAFGLSMSLQLGVIIIAQTRDIFGITMPNLTQWLIIVGIVIFPVVLVEIQKAIKRSKHKGA